MQLYLLGYLHRSRTKYLLRLLDISDAVQLTLKFNDKYGRRSRLPDIIKSDANEQFSEKPYLHDDSLNDTNEAYEKN